MKINCLILLYTLTASTVPAMHIKNLSTHITYDGIKKPLLNWLHDIDYKSDNFRYFTKIIDATDMPKFHELGKIYDLVPPSNYRSTLDKQKRDEITNSINQGNFIHFEDTETLITHQDPYSIDLVEIKACYKAYYFEHRLKKTLIQKLNLQTDTTPFFCYPESTITVHRTTKRFYEWINLCWTYDLCWRYKNKTKPDDELKDELKIEYDKYKKSFGDTQVFCSIDTKPYFKEIGTINTLDNDTLDDLKKGAYYFPNVLRGISAFLDDLQKGSYYFPNVLREISAFLLAPEKKPWTYKGFFLEYYFKTLLEKSDAKTREELDLQEWMLNL